MENSEVLHENYILCGFINILQFFPAFVYPVFRKEDNNGEFHYYFEDGKSSTIQQFYEIDLKTFPELMTYLPTPMFNFSTGSDTIYAYALSPNDKVEWGNIKEFIPALMRTLPTISSSAHRRGIKRFIFQHWKELLTRQQKKSGHSLQENLEHEFIGRKHRMGEEFCPPAREKSTEKLDVFQDFLTLQGRKRNAQAVLDDCIHRSFLYRSLEFTTIGLAIAVLLFVTVMWYGNNYLTKISTVPDNPIGNSDRYSSDSGGDPRNDAIFLSNFEYINPTFDSPIVGNLRCTFSTSDPYSSTDQAQQMLDVVAIDSQTGKEYERQDLVDKFLLIPYHEGDQECFFYGQINEEGNYDGRCIVNVYKEHKLLMITDSYYKNGKLLSCKQMFSYTTSRDEQVWAFSSRVPIDDNFRSGDTWTYFYKEIVQKFSSEDVSSNDIMTSNDFDKLIEMIGAQKEGYYNGTTRNGTFEDITGNAYMVKYFKESGTVRTLYVGQIKNGNFNDDTGNAWMIGKKTVDQSSYSYFKGPFIQNKAGKGFWDYNLSQDKINYYRRGYTFQCPLPGLDEDETESMKS